MSVRSRTHLTLLAALLLFSFAFGFFYVALTARAAAGPRPTLRVQDNPVAGRLSGQLEHLDTRIQMLQQAAEVAQHEGRPAAEAEYTDAAEMLSRLHTHATRFLDYTTQRPLSARITADMAQMTEQIQQVLAHIDVLLQRPASPRGPRQLATTAYTFSPPNTA